MELALSILLPYAFCSSLAYFTVIVVYRLYFHPLAKFPGPKLNAATQLVEIYYEVVRNGGGQYIFEIQKMHKKYGPIVRISPYELHIDDAAFYPDLYTGPQSRSADKCQLTIDSMGGGAGGATIEANHHRLRRKAVNPYFSKLNMYRMEPLFWKYTKRLCDRLDEYRIAEKPVKLGPAMAAYGIDILTDYCFAFCYDHLALPDFGEFFHDSNDVALNVMSRLTYFQFIVNLLLKMHSLLVSVTAEKTQEWLTLMMGENTHSMLKESAHLESYVDAVIENGNADHEAPESRRTLIHEIFVDESQPPEERTRDRMFHEAQYILSAGSATSPAFTCSIAHILSNKDVEHKLRESLSEVMANFSFDNPPRLADLEKVDYLRGVIYEGLRLAYGASHRLQRVMPEPLRYKTWTIPPRTPIGMSAPFTHHDETTYPDSHSFIPERWIDTKGLPVTKHFATFSKGPRNCLGMHLIFAEFYILLATLFRPGAPTLELYETNLEDVALVHDFFLPMPRAESKGVRILVK